VAEVVRTVPRAREARAQGVLATVPTRPHPALAAGLEHRPPVGRLDDDALLAMLPGRGVALVSVAPGVKELRFVDPADEKRWVGPPN
jgi:hypothetical protein